MGIHGDNSIRRPGGVAVLLRDGLYAAHERSRLTSNGVRNDVAEVFSGDKDAALTRGERFYVTAIHVGSEVVTMGLLSLRDIPGAGKSSPVWCSVNFFFPEDVLAQADSGAVFKVLDQWLAPEGTAPQAAASVNAAQPAPVPTAPSVSASTTHPVQLRAGMTEEEVRGAIGAPHQDIEFGDRRWLIYQSLTVLLEAGKVVSVEANSDARTMVRISSDPNAAEIYLDGSFVGSAPAMLRLQSGTYKIMARMPGFTDWERELKVMAGADVSVNAKLSK